MSEGIVNIRMEDGEGMCVASSIQVLIPEDSTPHEARRLILQEIVHCLDYYAIEEMIGDLKCKGVVKEKTYG